jgi:hypothetical protein|tara:strand:+ start:396 stop:647 length:252 start_codon:yes stop_codon:yes gene_type:complete
MKNKIELIENNSKEIKNYVEEMLLSMENKLNIDTHEKKLSNEFWQNYKEFNLNMGISYYLNNPIKANICSTYLLNQFEKSKKK